MFSIAQKRFIASELEKVLLNLEHPEMPTEKPTFHLRVEGKERWSWAEIKPNHTFTDLCKPGVNPHNEAVAEEMEKKK